MTANISKIRILQIGGPLSLFGAERWILALIKNLDLSKFDPWVAVIKDDPSQHADLYYEAKKLGYQAHLIESFGKFSISAIKKLRNLINQNNIQILHSHVYKQDLIGLLSASGTGCKIVTTPHGWSKNVDLKLWCYETLDRCLFPFFDAVVPLSMDLYSPLHKLPGFKNKVHLIENGIDLSELDDEVGIADEIVSLKKSGNYIIGYIGQLIPRKNLNTLLHAVSQLTITPDWKLAIVGDGPYKETLQELAEKLGISQQVYFFGFRKDRLSFLRGFDTFVLPSMLEGIPRCLMEAMALNVPVIASDIPGCNDLVSDKQTGLLFPPKSSKELTEALELLAGNHELRARLTEKGQELIQTKFSARRMAKEYEKLYRTLLF